MEKAIEYHNKRRSLQMAIQEILFDLEKWDIWIRECVKRLTWTWKAFLGIMSKSVEEIRKIMLDDKSCWQCWRVWVTAWWLCADCL